MDHQLETLENLFTYDPETGEIKNKVDRGSSKKGNPVGSPGAKGYLRVSFLGSSMAAHRIAWALFYGYIPNKQIDHKNLNKSDNRIENLRLASNSQNAMNRKLGPTNTSGHKGVYWNKSANKWIAVVRRNGEYVLRKGFNNIEDAAKAAELARSLSHQEFCNQE